MGQASAGSHHVREVEVYVREISICQGCLVCHGGIPLARTNFFIFYYYFFNFKKLMPSNIQYPHSHNLMQSANLMSLTSAKRKCHLRDKMQQKGRRLCSHFTCQAAGRYHFYTCVKDVFIIIKLGLVEIKFHFKSDFFIKIILFYLRKTRGVINTDIKYVFGTKSM